MALLRECLQELRVRQREWDELPSGWPQAKAASGPYRLNRMSALPLRPAAPIAQPLLRAA